ncbi:MAG TPA: alpha/beta hydrolase [Bauldia sp.]|nr:alpha/beta hydrolase [Bauldia sp.]
MSDVYFARANAVYRDQTAPSLEREYNLIALRPDFQTAIASAWKTRSAAFRAAANAKLDLSFGADPRDLLDLFPAGNGSGPLVVFLHGGYWQRGSKDMYSFVAAPFAANGISTAVLDYNLCPSVRISEIAPQVARSLVWLWRNAAALGFSRDKIIVTGASAGGHLTAAMLTTDWVRVGAPDDLIKAAIPISGIFDLEPLRFTSINDAVRMDADEARAESPLFKEQPRKTRQLVVVGALETTEFHRQSDEYSSRRRAAGIEVERYSEPDVDHFDVVNRFADERSQFFAKAQRLIAEATGSSS